MIEPIGDTETLGQRIRRLRKARGFSLAKVGGDDFSRAFLNQVEFGKAKPSIRLLRIIASRLGTNVEYLVEGREASLDREVALEKARALLLIGEPHRALLALRPALGSLEWPLLADVRLCHAEALRAYGKEKEAAAVLEEVKKLLVAQGDRDRLQRAQALERGGSFRFTGDAVKTHLLAADRAQHIGNAIDALEHYRAARVLLEAKAPTQT